MKKLFYILIVIFTLGLISCGGNEPKPEGNARLSIRGITFHEIVAAEKITGTVVTKTYEITDTSSSLVIKTYTNNFNITAPVDFNQFYDYNLPANIKKITFDIKFTITGSIAEKLSIEDINFTHNNKSLYSKKKTEFIDAGDVFVLPTIEVNY